MKLYHWTQPRYLLGIIVHGGLMPCGPYDGLGFMTAGKPVVWLTARDTRTPTPDDIEHMRTHPNFDDAAREKFSTRLFGLPDDIRLTVKFNSTNSKKLKPYWSWIQQFQMVNPDNPSDARACADLLGHCTPTQRNAFYVHLGRVPLAQIEMPLMTSAYVIAGLEYNLEGAEGEAREHLLKQLEAVKAAAPDAPVNIKTAALRSAA